MARSVLGEPDMSRDTEERQGLRLRAGPAVPVVLSARLVSALGATGLAQRLTGPPVPRGGEVTGRAPDHFGSRVALRP